MAYHGPGYFLPTGPGKYIISAWGLQRDMAEVLGALQVRLACLTNINPGYYKDVTVRPPDAPEHVDVVQRHRRHHDGRSASTACRPVRRRAW